MRAAPLAGYWQAIITQLKDEGDEMSQLAGLTELCEYLSISTEESLMTFPTEQVVPLLVGGIPSINHVDFRSKIFAVHEHQGVAHDLHHRAVVPLLVGGVVEGLGLSTP